MIKHPVSAKMASNNPIELPDELWIIIFTYLCTEDIFQNVILVCKRFHILCMDSTCVLIKKMSLSRGRSSNFDSTSQDREYKLLKTSKHLTSFILNFGLLEWLSLNSVNTTHFYYRISNNDVFCEIKRTWYLSNITF